MDIETLINGDAAKCLTSLGGEPRQWIYAGASFTMLSITGSGAGSESKPEFFLVVSVTAPIREVCEYYRDLLREIYETVDCEEWDGATMLQSQDVRIVIAPQPGLDNRVTDINIGRTRL